jgi:hypothetical protein
VECFNATTGRTECENGLTVMACAPQAGKQRRPKKSVSDRALIKFNSDLEEVNARGENLNTRLTYTARLGG